MTSIMPAQYLHIYFPGTMYRDTYSQVFKVTIQFKLNTETILNLENEFIIVSVFGMMLYMA